MGNCINPVRSQRRSYQRPYGTLKRSPNVFPGFRYASLCAILAPSLREQSGGFVSFRVKGIGLLTNCIQANAQGYHSEAH